MLFKDLQHSLKRKQSCVRDHVCLATRVELYASRYWRRAGVRKRLTEKRGRKKRKWALSLLSLFFAKLEKFSFSALLFEREIC